LLLVGKQGVVADVSSPEDRLALIELAEKLFDAKLSILVNNAGLNIRKPTVELTAADWETVMNTNIVATYNLCQVQWAV
jgi:tropinone reductase I